MCRTGQEPEPGEEQDVAATDAVFTSLLEDSAEELYEQAPCGYLLLDWLGLDRSQVVGRMRFSDLLTVGGRLYHETHFAPLLQMKGEVSGIALDIRPGGRGSSPAVRGRPRTPPGSARCASAEPAPRRTARDSRPGGRVLLPHGFPGSAGRGTSTTCSPLGSGRWAFFLGDVCGKGPQAATVTSLARYCTAIFGVLEPEDGHVGVHLASGGHPSALIQRADGSTDSLPTPGGLLIGVLPQAPFTAVRARLLPGDTLLLTDGLTEARTGPDRELFGEDALRQFVAGQPPAGPQDLITALSGLPLGFGEGLDDDTAPELRRTAAGLTMAAKQLLVVDLTGLDFCDSRGLSALLPASKVTPWPWPRCPRTPPASCASSVWIRSSPSTRMPRRPCRGLRHRRRSTARRLLTPQVWTFKFPFATAS